MELGSLILLLVVIPLILLIVLVGISYVKAPPDTALIISGMRRVPKVLIGKSGFRIPFLQRLDRIPLELIQIDVKSRNAIPTAEFIDVQIDGVANIKISKEEEFIAKASQHFLNMHPEAIAAVAKENLEGNLREIVGKMKLEELLKDRDVFAENVKQNAAEDMSNMGFEIVNFTVQDIRDEHGAIRDMGVDNLEQIKKHAAFAKARAKKEVEVVQAENDKLGNEARAKADAEIARQNRDLALRQAEFKREEDEAKAKAEAAEAIERELQQKTINVNAADAEVAKAERTAEIEQRNIAVETNRLDAQVRANADAERYAREQRAEAEKRAQILEAEAMKEEALRDAEAIKARGEAEAEAIRAKGLAEAEAIREKAEAMKEMKDAAIIEMVLEQLPEIATAIAKPMESIDNITLYDPNGTTELQRTVTAGINQVFDSASSAGIDLKSILGGMIGGKVAGRSTNQDSRTESESLPVMTPSAEESIS